MLKVRQLRNYKGRFSNPSFEASNFILFRLCPYCLPDVGCEVGRCFCAFGGENKHGQWRRKIVKWQSHSGAELKTKPPPLFYRTEPSFSFLAQSVRSCQWAVSRFMCSFRSVPICCRVVCFGRSCLLQCKTMSIGSSLLHTFFHGLHSPLADPASTELAS